MFDDVLPVRRVVVSSQVGLKLAAEDLESGTLANAVGADQSQHVSGPRHRKAVELEAICRISVSNLALEVGREVDDRDGTERAPLWANTASNAELLRDES